MATTCGQHSRAAEPGGDDDESINTDEGSTHFGWETCPVLRTIESGRAWRLMTVSELNIQSPSGVVERKREVKD